MDFAKVSCLCSLHLWQSFLLVRLKVYEGEKDTVLLTVQLPLKERNCMFGNEMISITTYTYKVNKNQVSVKKTEGIRRDCNADDIQKVEAVTYKKFLLDTLTDKMLTEL